MCEMADIDGILTGEDPMPQRIGNETEKAFDEKCIYWKTANEHIAGSIWYSLEAGGWVHLAGPSCLPHG